MKLLSLKYGGVDNSLKDYEFDFSTGRQKIGKLEPLCFVGLNGSGKSKLIEALAEIFFLLDAQLHSTTKKGIECTSDFELRYLLGDREYLVIGKKDRSPLVKELFEEGEREISRDNYARVMPSRIVGYSSGYNETISPLFKRLRRSDLSSARSKIAEAGDVTLSRTLFLDRDTTKLLLLTAFIFEGVAGDSNYLNKSNSCALTRKFSDFLNVKGLLSFQIDVDDQKGSIQLTRRMMETIQGLEKCALTTSKIGLGGSMTFFLNDVSRNAFIKTFGNAQSFFDDLYELNSLNLLEDKNSSKKIFDIPEDLLKIELDDPNTETTYQSLSDGEHQFIQVFGAMVTFARDDTLFLLDEPESHFNPVWRARFVFLLNDLLSKKQKDAEFLISTHSPYLVSACKKANVVKFVRDKNGVRHELLEDQTYGASFDVLLGILFDMKGLVSEVAKKDLENLVKSKELSVDEKIEKLESDFGASYEKRLLINMLKKGLLDVVSS